MKRFLVIYTLCGLITSMAYADAYQSLLKAYNYRQPAENLYAQIGRNLSKRVATEAERSNLSFIAIYGGVAQWNQNNLVDKLHALTSSSSTYINDTSLTSDQKRYRTEHYVNLVVLCVVSHLRNKVKNYNDIVQAIQNNVKSFSMHLDVFNRLVSLKAHDLKYILTEFNFKDSYKLAKEYVNFYESIKGNAGKIDGRILDLSQDQTIKYEEELAAITELNKDYEDRKTTVAPVPVRAPLNHGLRIVNFI